MSTKSQRILLFAERVVLPTDDGLSVSSAAIEVRGSTIARVERIDRSGFESTWVQPGIEAHDLGDRIVAPAFVDAHTHLSMGAFRGLIGRSALRGNVIEDLFYRLESGITAEDVRAFTRLGAYECLAHGVGTVWDHYYHGEAVAQALRDVGLCGVVTPTLQDLEGPGKNDHRAQLEATLRIDGDTDLAEAGIFAGLGPHATDTVSPQLWREVAEVAAAHALPVHAHVAQSIEEYERCHARHGCSPVELLQRQGVLDQAPSMLLVHAIFVDQADLGRLHASRHALAYCPLSQLQFQFPADVGSWTQAELPWVVATDCAASNDAMNVQRELPLVAGTRGFAPASSSAYRAFVQAGNLAKARAVDAQRLEAFERVGALGDPSFLLSRVWSVPGTMHPRMKTGAIEHGALANLMVLDANHPTLWPALDIPRTLAMADTASAIDRLMVAGAWRPVGMDLRMDGAYREARHEADRRLERLLKRQGISA